jgi:hypothetical protein
MPVVWTFGFVGVAVVGVAGVAEGAAAPPEEAARADPEERAMAATRTSRTVVVLKFSLIVSDAYGVS